MNVNYPNLKAEMARKGEKLNTLSDLLDLSISQVSKRMNGQIEWTLSEIITICDHYGKTFEELFK